MGHCRSFRPVFLQEGPLSSNLLSYFRLGQTCSKTNNLRIFLESFWLHPPLMLSPTSPRQVLFGFSLACSFSLSDSSFSREDASLGYLNFLPSYNVVIWTDGSVPFSFGKSGSGVLANWPFCGTEATLSFLAGPVCSSFSAEACAILQVLYRSRQHQQVCHCFCLPYPTLTLFSPHCTLLHLSFKLNHSGKSGANCLLSPLVLSGYSESPDTHFLREMTRLAFQAGSAAPAF